MIAYTSVTPARPVRENTRRGAAQMLAAAQKARREEAQAKRDAARAAQAERDDAEDLAAWLAEEAARLAG